MAVSTAAQTRKEVDSTSVRDRIWDSLNYTYGKRGEEIGKEYDKLSSQTSNALLGRGMQRSSYGAQTVANVGTQRANAIAQNQSDLIADYENRLYQVEQDELAAAQWQKQYEESVRQFNEQMAENKRQFDLQYALQQAASSGSGGGSGSGGSGGDYTGVNYSGTGLTNAEAFAAELNNRTREDSKKISDSTAKNANQQTATRSEINDAWTRNQIAGYQSQINSLSKRLATASSNSERVNINNQIKALQQKINSLS